MKQLVKNIGKGITVVFHKIGCAFVNKNVKQNMIIENLIAEALKAYAKVFSGLYEPMNMVASGKLGGKLGTFDEWCLRSGNIKDIPSFSDRFTANFSGHRNWKDSEYIKNAQLILRGIYKADITRDSFSEFIVEQDTLLRYGAIDGRTLIEGESVQILMPCWHQNASVLEKGIVK